MAGNQSASLDSKKRKLLVEYARRIRAAEEDKKLAAEEIKDSLEAAEGAGLDKQALKHAVKMLRDAEKIGVEQYELFDTVRDVYFLALREDILGAGIPGEVRKGDTAAKKDAVAKVARQALGGNGRRKKKPAATEGDLASEVRH